MATAAQREGTGKRAGLDRDAVVDAALALVERDGGDALSMRNLAQALGVGTTTIYWHAGSRDELVEAIIVRQSERQAAGVVEGTTPTARVCSVAHRIWTNALTHRNVTSLAHQHGATALLQLPMERALAIELEAAGLQGDEVRDALRAILACVAGFLVSAFREGGTSEGAPAQSHELWAGTSDDGLAPDTVAALATSPDLATLFETTVAAVVASFVADSTVPNRSTR